MKRTLYAAGLAVALTCTASAQVSMETARQMSPATGTDVADPLPDYDVRHAGDSPSGRVRALATAGRGGETARERDLAVQRLAERVPGLAVDWDPVFGTPRFVRSSASLLTGPSLLEPAQIVERFVASQRAIFGIGAGEIESARVSRDFLTKHNGVRHLGWQQEIDGIDLFGAELRANVARDGRLINVSSTMLPRPSGGFDVPAVALRPLAAIRIAAESVGVAMSVDPAPLDPPSSDAAEIVWTQTPDFRADLPVTSELVYFPLDRRAIVPAWKIQVPEIGIGSTYVILVDATNGAVLWRYNLLNFLGGTQDVTLRIYTSDSPTPGSPGLATPGPGQPFQVARTLLTVTPGDVAATSPNHWISDGDNETNGNNVDAHTDLNADNLPDLPRPTGSPFRVFDFALDLSQAPSAYEDAAVTNLFYHCNRYHDRLYELGFDEAAGNFQLDNFGQGGAGGDPVQADAQDGIGLNNANFGTPADGSSGRMQMFVWSGPTPDRDGDLDAEIIYHEYSHGLSNRLVGVGTLGGEQSGGMGEGWGDYFGISLLAEAADNLDGNYPFVGYSTKDWNGQAENYYFGIRRFPYSTDIASVNPLTYADTDPAQNAYPPGIPQSAATSNDPDAVHKVGEVWCVTLLECRKNLWNAQGFSGNQLMMQLVLDGMKLTPGNPNFIDARDAILQADLVNNGGANLAELWEGFAKRGLGENASSPSGGSSTTGVVEDFTEPSLIVFDYPLGIPSQLQPGVPTTFDVNVTGLGAATPTPGTGQIHYSINGGMFQAAAMTVNAPDQYTAELPASSCFDTVDFYVSVGSSGGTVTDPSNAPTETRLAQVYTGTLTVFADDFETNQGWTVTDSPGLVEGTWERGVPVDNDRSDPPADSDGSGQCYLTENDPLDSNSDIDDGITTLTSPAFDLSGGGLIHYDYWLWDETNPIGPEDGMTVDVATNAGGTNWQTVRIYPGTAPTWRSDTIQVGIEVAASSTVRIRFNAQELSPGDVLEAGIDAVLVEVLECAAASPSFCDASDGSLASCPCANPGDPDAGCDIAQGTGGVRMDVVAQETSPQNRVTATGTGYPSASTPSAVVIRASALDSASPVVFGDGLRCIATPLVRLGATLASGGSSTHEFGHGAGAGAGTFRYQLWFRNTPASFCDPIAAFNLSNGRTLTW